VFEILQSTFASIAVIAAAMAAVAFVETIVPLRARGHWSRAHLAPNLALTAITLAANVAFNVAIALLLEAATQRGIGALDAVALPGAAVVAITVVALDFSFYAAHVAMHRVPALWRFHRVHHSDPMLDVTTTIRQHPGESVFRFVCLGAAAVALGAPAAAFAIYRVASTVNGLLEHANVRLPRWLDALLGAVFVTPDLHKVHHARAAALTDTNYGNLFSWFDRAFGTRTPPECGRDVVYGLDGLDDAATQSTAGLLALPFRRAAGQRRRIASTSSDFDMSA
jgi:sterol desaturase/sphingolipid hydroxylase (fatty acid hydroxylase superfamily)